MKRKESKRSKEIFSFEEEIRERVKRECEKIKKAENPERALEEYLRNIRWDAPDLATYLKKEMLNILNSSD